MMIWILLLVFQLKHFLADFPLQGSYMLGKFKSGTDWILPLAAHAGVHFLFTLAICVAVKPSLWWLAIVDFCVHFTVDRIKASPKMLGQFKPTQPIFWWCLGWDQAMHHCTHYFIIWALVQ